MIPVIAPAITFPKINALEEQLIVKISIARLLFQLLLQLQSDFHKLKSSYIKVNQNISIKIITFSIFT